MHAAHLSKEREQRLQAQQKARAAEKALRALPAAVQRAQDAEAKLRTGSAPIDLDDLARMRAAHEAAAAPRDEGHHQAGRDVHRQFEERFTGSSDGQFLDALVTLGFSP